MPTNPHCALLGIPNQTAFSTPSASLQGKAAQRSRLKTDVLLQLEVIGVLVQVSQHGRAPLLNPSVSGCQHLILSASWARLQGCVSRSRGDAEKCEIITVDALA